MVYTDKGAPMKSGEINNLLEALGVKLVVHKAGNPRAKGIVENAFRTMQVDFETELRHCPASSIEELNDRAYNWQVDHNWKVKSGESRPRMQMWQTITNEQLRELPPMHILRHVTASDIIRTVDVYSTIRLNNEIYGVPGELVGKKVRVWRNIDGGLAVQDVETGTMHPTVDRRTAKFGEFHAHKRTEAERRQDNALRIVESIRDEITPEVLRRDPHNLTGIERTGQQIEVESDLIESDCYESVYKAKLAIADELRVNLGDLPDWMVTEIEAALRETLEKERVLEIARYVGQFLKEMTAAS
jgi:hypothetical protein